jgi:hypothetical protein
MYKPGTRIYKVLILFTEEGIVITGDLCFGANQRGIVSAYGYSLPWFASELSEGYLAEKFLIKVWECERAAEDVAVILKRIEQGEYDERIQSRMLDGLKHNDISLETARNAVIEHYKHVVEMLKNEDVSMDRFRDLVEDVALGSLIEAHMFDIVDDLDSPGFGYPINEMGWLAAVQKKFAELYHATKPLQGATH